MKYYLLTFNEDWADEHDVPALEVMDENQFNEWSNHKHEEIYAYLGNGGEGFMEDNQGLTGSELIEQKYVNVFEVDESFRNQFVKAKLSDLSLCNVFSGWGGGGWDTDEEE